MRFLFAHGAGAPSSSEWMQAWAQRLKTLGKVAIFDYPYMAAGKKSPDRPHKLIAAHRQAIAHVRTTDEPLVLIGKSMGGRIGCHAALEEPVAALVCLGYPLVSPGRSGNVRDAVLLELRTPILFVQGSKDRLCPLDRLAEVCERMQAPNDLHVVQGGDHSLRIGKRELAATGTTQDAVDQATLAAIGAFLKQVA